MGLPNPFRKQRSMTEERTAGEQLERELKEKERQESEARTKEAYREASIKESEENARYAARREAMRKRYDKRERLARMAHGTGTALDKLARLDRQRTYSTRRIRYSPRKKGMARAVTVEGQSPVPQPQAFDNRFAHLFDVSQPHPAISVPGTGRNFGGLVDHRKIFGRRKASRW